MLSYVLLTFFAVGTTHIEVPDFVYKDGESDIFVNVCESGEADVWRKGSFDNQSVISWNVNLAHISVGIAVGPYVVREEMSKMFEHIEDGPNVDDRDSQLLANEFALFQWYQIQLEKCTELCYKDVTCYATWARMKNWVQNPDEVSTSFPELAELVTADNRYQTWFACHKLNDAYLTGLRGVTNDDNGEFMTYKIDSNDVYVGFDNDRNDFNVLASHYWVKPASGFPSCLEEHEESDEESDVIKIFATVTVVEE